MCHRNTTEEYVFHYAPAAEHEDPAPEGRERREEHDDGEDRLVRPADD
ncbi:hypothetical protein [Halomarina litorea]|nr:hypothetical protein [Halomarina sp. BCD28]